MYEKLDTQRLKSGEELEIGVVSAPDAQYLAGIEELLVHKGPEWQRHIDSALRGETGSLETRFYLGLLEGRPVGNVMTVERHGVGILGHVFTRPEHRRKGICQSIMARQMEHFRQRGGHVLLLGTGFESPPYWIYHAFGFRSLKGGFMRYAVEPDSAFEDRWFAPGSTRIAEAEWGHWPLAALLLSVPGREYLRSAAWRMCGIGNAEGPFCLMMAAKQRGLGVNGIVLEKENGAVVGIASVYPTDLSHSRWPEVWVIDVFTHPHFTTQMPDLLNALPVPAGKRIAYVDTDATEKAAVFEACGYEREGMLRRFLRADGLRRDVWIYGRE